MDGNLIFVHHGKKANSIYQSFMGLFSKELWQTTVLLWIIWFSLSYGIGYAFITPIVYAQLSKDTALIYVKT
jgi:hypothetical protein